VHKKPESNRNCITQVKVSVMSEVAKSFKAACKANDSTMVEILSDYMRKYSKVATQKGEYSPNLSSRRQRRAAIQAIIRQLERIRENEDIYRDNIPENLHGGNAYEVAEQSVIILEEAIDILSSVY